MVGEWDLRRSGTGHIGFPEWTGKPCVSALHRDGKFREEMAPDKCHTAETLIDGERCWGQNPGNG
ncbi:MAG: hypothetical protein ACYCYP_05800 [Leptospirales bacterium]